MAAWARYGNGPGACGRGGDDSGCMIRASGGGGGGPGGGGGGGGGRHVSVQRWRR